MDTTAKLSIGIDKDKPGENCMMMKEGQVVKSNTLNSGIGYEPCIADVSGKKSEKENTQEQEPIKYVVFDEEVSDDEVSLHLKLSDDEPETENMAKPEMVSNSKDGCSYISGTSAGPSSEEDCVILDKSSAKENAQKDQKCVSPVIEDKFDIGLKWPNVSHGEAVVETIKETYVNERRVGKGMPIIESNVDKDAIVGESEQDASVSNGKAVGYNHFKKGISARQSQIKKTNTLEESPIGDNQVEESVSLDENNIDPAANGNSSYIRKRSLGSDVELGELKKAHTGSGDQKQRKETNGKRKSATEMKGNPSCSTTHNSIKHKKDQPLEESVQTSNNVHPMEQEVIEVEDVSAKGGEKERVRLSYLRRFKRKVTKMTRNDLEEFVLQKICEAIADECELAKLRHRVVKLEEMAKHWHKTALQMSQRTASMGVVIRKFEVDLKNRREEAVPIKLTRGVGLQVGSTSPFLCTPDSSSFDVDPLNCADASNSHEGLNEKSRKDLVTPSTSKALEGITVVPIPSSCSPDTSSSRSTNSTNGTVPKVSPGLKQQPIHSQSVSAKVPTRPVVAPVPSSPSRSLPLSLPSNSKFNPSDVKTIDLTDDEDETKNNAFQAVNSSVNSSNPNITATASSSPISSAVDTLNNATKMANATLVGRPMGVVHRSGASVSSHAGHTISGSQLALLLPTSNVPVHQVRQGRRVPTVVTSGPVVRSAGVAASAIRPAAISSFILTGDAALSAPPISNNASNFFTRETVGAVQIKPPGASQPFQLRVAMPVTAVVPAARAAYAHAPARFVTPSHPAPFPPVPAAPLNARWKLPPPRPDLAVSRMHGSTNGVKLTWNMLITDDYDEIASYQLFAYEESTALPSPLLWKKVGDVKALSLPMMCTLTQFLPGHKYHLSVRAVDVHARCGPFSAPGQIVLPSY